MTCFGHKRCRSDGVSARSLSLKGPVYFCLLFCVFTFGMETAFLGYPTGTRKGTETRQAELSRLSCSSWGQFSSVSYTPATPQPRAADPREQKRSLLCAPDTLWQEITDPPISSNQAKVGKKKKKKSKAEKQKSNIKKQTLIRKRTNASLNRAKFELSTYQGVIFRLPCLPH